MKSTFALLLTGLFFFSASAQWSWGTKTADSARAIITEDEPENDIAVEAAPTDPEDDVSFGDNDENYPRPGLLPFNFNQEGKAESYPFISADGLHLIFVHDQSSDWLFYCSRATINDAWSVPIPLEFRGIPELKGYTDGISSARLLSGAFITDENTLVICGSWDGGGKIARFFKDKTESGVYHFDTYIRVEDGLGIEIEQSFISNLSFSSASSEMFAYFGDNTVCMKEVTDAVYRVSYTVGQNLTLMGKVTPDGLAFITEKTFERPERGELLVLKRNSFDEPFSLDNSWVLYRNDGLGLLQPSYSPALNAVVLVENAHGGWSENNIFTVPVDITNTLERYTPPENLGIAETEAIYVPDDYMIFDSVYTTAVEMPATLNESITVMEKTSEILRKSGEEVAKVGIGKAFPNPTNGVFYIFYQANSQNEGEKARIDVFNMAGEVVKSVDVQSGNHSSAVDLSQLSAGTYQVSVSVAGLRSEAVNVILSK